MFRTQCSKKAHEVQLSIKSTYGKLLKVSKLPGTFLCGRYSQRLFFIVIKVTSITRTLAFRDKWRLDLQQGVHKLKY